MPEMDGYEVSRKIIAYQKGWGPSIKKSQLFGKQKLRHEVPIVAVTAYTDSSVKKNAI